MHRADKAGPGRDPRVIIGGGGQGYNTAIDDCSNLAWKLAAVCQGWGGAGLLATHQGERRPIAERNTRFARATKVRSRRPTRYAFRPSSYSDGVALARARYSRSALTPWWSSVPLWCGRCRVPS